MKSSKYYQKQPNIENNIILLNIENEMILKVAHFNVNIKFILIFI